jgi:hypothetical protein
MVGCPTSGRKAVGLAAAAAVVADAAWSGQKSLYARRTSSSSPESGKSCSRSLEAVPRLLTQVTQAAERRMRGPGARTTGTRARSTLSSGRAERAAEEVGRAGGPAGNGSGRPAR